MYNYTYTQYNTIKIIFINFCIYINIVLLHHTLECIYYYMYIICICYYTYSATCKDTVSYVHITCIITHYTWYNTIFYIILFKLYLYQFCMYISIVLYRQIQSAIECIYYYIYIICIYYYMYNNVHVRYM